jgi:hypothetical protein
MEGRRGRMSGVEWCRGRMSGVEEEKTESKWRQNYVDMGIGTKSAIITSPRLVPPAGPCTKERLTLWEM